jgi:hypothetical protein
MFEVTRIFGIRQDISVIGKDYDAECLHPLVRATRKVQDLLEDLVVAGTIPRILITFNREVAGVSPGVFTIIVTLGSRLDTQFEILCWCDLGKLTLDIIRIHIYMGSPAWRTTSFDFLSLPRQEARITYRQDDLSPLVEFKGSSKKRPVGIGTHEQRQ